MKALIAASLLALSVSGADAADCAKYVHEIDADDWFVVNGDRVLWSGRKDEPAWFLIKQNDNPRITLAVKDVDQENDADLFALRFGNLDGVEGFISDGAFYRKIECAPADRVTRSAPEKPKLLDRLLTPG